MLSQCSAVGSRRVSLTPHAYPGFGVCIPRDLSTRQELLLGGTGFWGWAMCVQACLEDERADSSFDHEILINVNGNYFKV